MILLFLPYLYVHTFNHKQDKKGHQEHNLITVYTKKEKKSSEEQSELCKTPIYVHIE